MTPRLSKLRVVTLLERREWSQQWRQEKVESSVGLHLPQITTILVHFQCKTNMWYLFCSELINDILIFISKVAAEEV